MAGLRERKKAETRQAIISSAVQLFTAKGFEKSSIEDIARNAGIGKATVYTYFPSKIDIFLTYCDDELEDAFENLKSYRPEAVPLLEQLLEFFTIKFKFITRNHEFGRQLLREMVFPGVVNEKVKEHDQRYFDYLEKLFQGAEARGEIAPNQDLFLLSAHFFSLYLGVLAGWYGGYLEDVADANNAMRTMFTHAIEGIGR